MGDILQQSRSLYAVLWPSGRLILALQTMVWLMTLSDALATYLDAYTSYSLACPRAVAHFPASTNSLLSASPLLIVGALAVFLGCLLRKWCFRKLGTLFTFELTIHPDHRLITTGPYSVVRHPSYTGIYLTLLGSTAVGLASGSYLRECWLGVGCSGQTSWAGTPGPDATDAGLLTLPSVGQVLVFSLVTFWLAKVCFALRSTNKRLAIEDAELHKIFGEVWEEYENSVRWKLVPGVY